MRTLKALLFVPMATALLYACGDDHTEQPPAGYEDVLYDGEVTDEALAALVAALEQGAPSDVPSQAPVLDMPAAGQLAKTPAPTFSWHVGATASRAPDGGGTLRKGPPVLLPAADTTDGNTTFVKGLGELLGPVRVAHAHGTPYTGYATFLVFSTASNPKLARVLTSSTSYTPSQTVWTTITNAGAEVTLTLTGASFTENRIAEGGGPFKGNATKFTIAP